MFFCISNIISNDFFLFYKNSYDFLLFLKLVFDFITVSFDFFSFVIIAELRYGLFVLRVIKFSFVEVDEVILLLCLASDMGHYDLKILDLCAGTGNISLEFASREAGMITSVDTNYNCCRFIQKMIDENNLNQVMNVVKADVRDYVRRCEQTYDLIFIDPPYEISFYDDLIALIFERNLLKTEEGLLVVEHGKKTDFSDHPNFERVKNYGNVNFSFFNA